MPDLVEGEIAKAYIILKSDTSSNEDKIMTFCRKFLVACKCPRKIQFVSNVPKTSTGKIMHRGLYTLDGMSDLITDEFLYQKQLQDPREKPVG